jgi:hypothetical protein
MSIKLAEAFEFSREEGTFVIAEKVNPDRVDDLLRAIAQGTLAGYSMEEAHQAMAAAMVEPIRQTVPYAEMYAMFFMDQTYDYLEDNSIPVEDIPTVSFETHRDGEAVFVRANYRFTRPEFTTWHVGIEVNWDDLRRAGWNYLARQMKYATESLARQRDEAAVAILDAAVVSGHSHTVSGGVLTRASVKAVFKAANTIGFPMTQCLVNSGTVTDMAEWTLPTGQQMPEPEQSRLIHNLYLGTYGGCNFYTNPHASTTVLRFSGPKTGLGWHQQRGGVEQASDVDIRKKMNEHAIYDADHAWHIGNAYNYRMLTITA